MKYDFWVKIFIFGLKWKIIGIREVKCYVIWRNSRVLNYDLNLRWKNIVFVMLMCM